MDYHCFIPSVVTTLSQSSSNESKGSKTSYECTLEDDNDISINSPTNHSNSSFSSPSNSNSHNKSSTFTQISPKASPQFQSHPRSLSKSKCKELNKSIKTNNVIEDKVNFHMIKPCQNMVNRKCKCDQLLYQNKDAYKIWSNCHQIHIANKYISIDNRQIILIYFDALYHELCEYFKYEIGTIRVPSSKDIAQSILHFGGFCVDDIGHDIVIDRCHFILFWRWYRGTLHIIQQNAMLWSMRFPFQIDLFLDRQKCTKILVNMPEGTFMLRLSRSKINGLVISYLKKEFDGKLNVKNILLVRQYDGKYSTNRNRPMSLSSLIRSFVKLKYVYTPNYIYNKSHIF